MIKICIVGAGFTGYLTAIALKKNCPQASITLIDSQTEPKNFGFGESCPPFFLRWLVAKLGIAPSEQQEWLVNFLKETNSTIKASVKLQNWNDTSDLGYFVPFVFNKPANDLIGQAPDSYKLTDLWYELYIKELRKSSDFDKDIGNLYYTLSDNRIPFEDQKFVESDTLTVNIASYEVMKWFEKHYKHLLDHVIDITVCGVELTETGSVKCLVDQEGNKHRHDLYLDCTGFKRILSKHVDFDWQPPHSRILHDSAVLTAKCYSNNDDICNEMVPYTTFLGMPYGWSWGIPLLNRKSYGYVFDSNYADADSITKTLVDKIGKDNIVQEPLLIKWTTGWNKQAWSKNVITVGIASGFIDALDANSIAIQTQQVNAIVNAVNSPRYLRDSRDTYNQLVDGLFVDLVDRQDIHFALAPRNDTDYWKKNHSAYSKQELLEFVNRKLTENIDSSGKFHLFFDMVWLTYFMYYGNDLSNRCRKSKPELIEAGLKYFSDRNHTQMQKSKNHPTPIEWMQAIGIDPNDKILVGKKI